MAKDFHPDNFFRKEIGGYRLRIQGSWKRVQEAYEILTTPTQRQKYDAELAARPKAPATPKPMPASATGTVRTVSSSPTPARPITGSHPIAEPPRVRMESALERRLKADVADRIGKARRHYEQAQADFKEKKWSAADSNIKLAIQFDPRNDSFVKWHETVRPQLEEGIVSAMLQKAEMASASGEGKGSLDFLEHAHRLFPENIEANRAFGLALVEKMGDFKVAKDCLQKVVLKRPKDTVALLNLGKAMRA